MKEKFLAYVFRILLNILLFTCRFKIVGLEHFIKVANNGSCILMLWHNRLLITGYVLSRFTENLTYAAFVSKSRDGRILSEFVDSYRRGRAIRVPHDARGQALKVLIDTIRNTPEIVLITPDGPRGPRYKVKPGVIKAQEATGAITIPFSWSSSSFWQLKTWDKLIIPKPFSTITVVFGEYEKGSFQEALEKTTECACQLQQSWPC